MGTIVLLINLGTSEKNSMNNNCSDSQHEQHDLFDLLSSSDVEDETVAFHNLLPQQQYPAEEPASNSMDLQDLLQLDTVELGLDQPDAFPPNPQAEACKNHFRIVRSLAPPSTASNVDMTILYACTELDSPKSKTKARSKKNPSHCIVAKNAHMTAQFYNNFQVIERRDAEPILSLKLGFQQKLFLNTNTPIPALQIKMVDSQATVAFCQTIGMQFGAALFVFKVPDKEQFRDVPFELQFLHGTEMVGKIGNVFCHAQYKFNSLKRKSVHLDQDSTPKSKKQKHE